MVDIRKDILLNECGDFAIVNGDLAIVDGVDQIRQSWLIHIRTLLGELITNVNDGVPWFQTILDKHSDLTAVEQIFFDETLKVPGILNVEGVEIEAFDLQARRWEITVTCTCEGEEGSQVFHYQGAMPVGTCTGTLAEDLPLSVDGLIVWFDAQDLGNLTYDPTAPSLRLENKGGEGYALAVGNGPELLIDGDMEAGLGPEDLVDGDMEAGPGPEELTDGDMEAGPGPEELTDGDMEDGPGSEELTDGDMEAAGTSAWTAGNSATLSKVTGTPHGGLQSLRVAYNGVANPYAYQTVMTIGRTYHIEGWARGDGSIAPQVQDGATVLWTGTLSTTWQSFSVDFVATSTEMRFYALAAAGGNCDFDDCSLVETCQAWDSGNSALLTKIGGVVPHAGLRCLKVAYNGVNNPYAYQTIVTSGRSYTITGWARGDATYAPSVQCGATVLWTGTNSVNWQKLSLSFTAGATDIRLYSNATTTGFCCFDDLTVRETCQYWSNGNSALLTKGKTIPHGGLQCLRVSYNAVNYPYAYQITMTTGRTYHVEGWARGDGSAYPRLTDSGGTTIWTGTSSTSWQNFDVEYVSTGTQIRLWAWITGAGYCEFEDCSVREICHDWNPGNSAFLTKETISPHGGSQCLRVSYNGTSNPYAQQSILAVSTSYNVHGWARSDGSYLPKVYYGGTLIWEGSLSTSWQEFDVDFYSSVGGQIRFFSFATASGYCEFDDCSVREICQYWTSGNSAFLTKNTVSPHSGVQCLKIEYSGTLDPYAEQSILVISDTYTIMGWARGDGTYAPIVKDGTTTIWTGTSSTSWQQFSVVRTAATTTIRFCSNASASGYSEFDDCSVTEGGGGFPELAGVSSLNQKRSVYLNNTVANKNTCHLAFFDTKALRTAGQNYTVFCVFKLEDDTGVSNYDYGLVSFRGQNDAGTLEECNYLSMLEDGSVPGNPDIIAYQRDNFSFTNSKASLTAADPFDPFYAMVEFLNSAITNFYYNGVSEPGDNTLTTRKLDGDGFIGAALGSDRETPEKFANGYFGELLVYEGKLSAVDITAINAYLANKWGF